ECLDGELLKNDGFVIGMPTSSGKTKVAEVTILKTLTKSPDALCIYIAPYRSLANEVEFSLSSMFEI
ncbi:DEAD/DEAH box helicase, partial [Bacillus cereus]